MGEPIQKMSYSQAYDLGLADAMGHQYPRHRAPRNASASAGRFGYSDGFSDGLQRRKGLDSDVTRAKLTRRYVVQDIRAKLQDYGLHPVGRVKRVLDEEEGIA